jgi:hypothetical protein
MPLSCECDYDENCDWYFDRPEDYSTLDSKRRRRCCSCKELIDVGATVLSFERWRTPQCESIEEKIYGEGENVPLAPWIMCERCGDIYFSLGELGFCVNLDESMLALLSEYQVNYGPKEKRCNQTKEQTT